METTNFMLTVKVICIIQAIIIISTSHISYFLPDTLNLSTTEVTHFRLGPPCRLLSAVSSLLRRRFTDPGFKSGERPSLGNIPKSDGLLSPVFSVDGLADGKPGDLGPINSSVSITLPFSEDSPMS